MCVRACVVCCVFGGVRAPPTTKPSGVREPATDYCRGGGSPSARCLPESPLESSCVLCCVCSAVCCVCWVLCWECVATCCVVRAVCCVASRPVAVCCVVCGVAWRGRAWHGIAVDRCLTKSKPHSDVGNNNNSNNNISSIINNNNNQPTNQTNN